MAATSLRQLRAYPILDDDTLGAFRILHDFGPHRGIDGMCLDTAGNIVATAGFEQSGPGPLIYVFAPSGRVIETHPVPGRSPHQLHVRRQRSPHALRPPPAARSTVLAPTAKASSSTHHSGWIDNLPVI